MMSMAELVLTFFLYSFAGWAFESFICPIAAQNNFKNSGFFIGPYCPIYGIGAVMCYLLFHGIGALPALFLISAVVCGILEYCTGFGLEKIFHAKLWDYSKMPFQIHGRVCLFGLLFFGALSVIVCKVTEPLFLGFTGSLPAEFTEALAMFLAVVFCLDCIVTTAGRLHLPGRVSQCYEDLYARTNHALAGASERIRGKVSAAVSNMQEIVPFEKFPQNPEYFKEQMRNVFNRK